MSAATWGLAFLPFRRLTGDTNRGHKKASLRVPNEVVVITLTETQREASAGALPPQGVVCCEVHYVSFGDRFAALQIVYAAGRCPPIFRLPSTDSFLSFQFFGLRFFSSSANSIADFTLLVWQNHIFAKMSGMFDLSSDEKAKHFLPR